MFNDNFSIHLFLFSAVGAGAVKSNMAVFGAEQIQDTQSAARYFAAYVLTVNIGAMTELWIIPWLQANTTGDHTDAYAIAAGMLGMAVLLFLLGCPWYRNINLNETVVSKCFPVLINAYQTWRRQNPVKHVTREEDFTSSTGDLLNGPDNLIEHEQSVRLERQPSSILDYANAVYGGEFHDRIVNDVKSLRRALVAFILLIPYWLLYSQVKS